MFFLHSYLHLQHYYISRQDKDLYTSFKKNCVQLAVTVLLLSFNSRTGYMI